MTHGSEVIDLTYSNRHENDLYNLASGLGWEVTKRGWPDFICWDGDNMILVEVKPPGHLLNQSQWRVMLALSRLGAKCFVYSGGALKPFDPDLPPDFYLGE